MGYLANIDQLSSAPFDPIALCTCALSDLCKVFIIIAVTVVCFFVCVFDAKCIYHMLCCGNIQQGCISGDHIRYARSFACMQDTLSVLLLLPPTPLAQQRNYEKFARGANIELLNSKMNSFVDFHKQKLDSVFAPVRLDNVSKKMPYNMYACV